MRYPRFYRLGPTVREIADGYVALVKTLGWNRVAMISHDIELYYTVRPTYIKLECILFTFIILDNPRAAVFMLI